MDKIKAIDPKIIVNRDVDRPYYSIEYYDTADNQWHIGYGSYELKNVIEWLKTDFDVVEADVEPVRHGHWIKTDNTWTHDYYEKGTPIYRCSLCGRYEKTIQPYCNCGAKNER